MTEDRTRQGRSEEVATQRRRRDNATLGISQKLHIPEEVAARLKAEGREPRWVNDEDNRIHNLTVADDYDRVDGVEPKPVGVAKDGKTPVLAYLLSKPAEFIAEDRAKLEAKRKDMERSMVKGHVPAKPGEEAAPVRGLMGAQTYVDGASSIGRGNQIIE